MSRRIRVAAIASVLLTAALAGFLVSNLDSEEAGDSGSADSSAAGSGSTKGALDTVAVQRRTLQDSEEIDGTVGHGTPVPLPIETEGTVTEAPERDDTLGPGDVAVKVNNQPVTIVRGEVPLYRELRRVQPSERDDAGVRLGEQSGPDVLQLQRFLTEFGSDAESGQPTLDGVFGAATEKAVKQWQKSIGHPTTGRVDRSQMIFLPSEVRVEAAPLVGQPFTPITVTSPVRTVTAQATNAQRTFFAVGVVVSLALDTGAVEGTVTKAARETSPDGATSYDITVEVSEPIPDTAGTIEITATKTVANDVLTVPVRALLALAEGGWALEVPVETNTELVGVELGSVVDGIAEISGVEDGTNVLVPS